MPISYTDSRKPFTGVEQGEMMSIPEEIGTPAVLEQAAEEAAELAQAALKLARKLRGENPCPVERWELEFNLKEEYADLMVCAELLKECGLLAEDWVEVIMERKMNRWRERIKEAKKDGGSGCVDS